MSKLTIRLVITYILALAAFKQYKFNLEVEWWTAHESMVNACEYWDTTIPTMISAQLANKEITKPQAKQWRHNIKKDRDDACTKSDEWHDLNSYMPYTDKWREERQQIGLNSYIGYVRDLFKKEYAVDGGFWDGPTKKKPSVRLTQSYYGPGDCSVTHKDYVRGPIPFTSRVVYGLDCVNEKTKKEGLAGFIATSTSDYMESIK